VSPNRGDGTLQVVVGPEAVASVTESVGMRSIVVQTRRQPAWPGVARAAALAWAVCGVAACAAEAPEPTPIIELGSADAHGKKWLSLQQLDWRPAIVYGHQGGHHVWIGVRVQGLDPVGLRMTLDMWLVESGVRVKPGRVVQVATLRQEGPWLVFSKLFGYLTCPCQVRDRELKVRVRVRDRLGREATAQTRITPRWNNPCDTMQRANCADICLKPPTSVCKEQ